jgi:hypothetical protein
VVAHERSASHETIAVLRVSGACMHGGSITQL